MIFVDRACYIQGSNCVESSSHTFVVPHGLCYIFQKSHHSKDYLHILSSSCYRQKHATWQTNSNSSLGMSSPSIISANHG
jgi:hypothetical protein